MEKTYTVLYILETPDGVMTCSTVTDLERRDYFATDLCPEGVSQSMVTEVFLIRGEIVENVPADAIG